MLSILLISLFIYKIIKVNLNFFYCIAVKQCILRLATAVDCSPYVVQVLMLAPPALVYMAGVITTLHTTYVRAKGATQT